MFCFRIGLGLLEEEEAAVEEEEEEEDLLGEEGNLLGEEDVLLGEGDDLLRGEWGVFRLGEGELPLLFLLCC